MFAYCNNNPVGFSDESGAAAKSCLSADGRIGDTPWRDISPSGGGRLSGNYSSGNNYGSPADKFYTVRLIKYVTNTDEQVVLDANFLAFYKGVPVIKVPIGSDAFSFFVIFLGSDAGTRQDALDVVRHEYGHSRHFSMIGMSNYTSTVFIPSVVGFHFGGKEYHNNYYSHVYEYTANFLGNAYKNETYLESTERWWWAYFIYTLALPK